MAYDPNGLGMRTQHAPCALDGCSLRDMFKERSSCLLMAAAATLLGGAMALNALVPSPRLLEDRPYETLDVAATKLRIALKM